MNVYYKAAQLVADSTELNKGSFWNYKKSCFCTMGAIVMAAGEERVQEIDFDYHGIHEGDEGTNSYVQISDRDWFNELMKPVADRIIANDEGFENRVPFCTIYPWNDAAGRTKDEVVQLLNQVGDDMDGK